MIGGGRGLMIGSINLSLGRLLSAKSG
jgi:hypothetical protein